MAGRFEVQTAAKGLAFSFEATGYLPEMVRADEKRVCQIFINLLGNAIQFTSASQMTFGRRPGADDYKNADGPHGRRDDGCQHAWRGFCFPRAAVFAQGVRHGHHHFRRVRVRQGVCRAAMNAGAAGCWWSTTRSPTVNYWFNCCNPWVLICLRQPAVMTVWICSLPVTCQM